MNKLFFPQVGERNIYSPLFAEQSFFHKNNHPSGICDLLVKTEVHFTKTENAWENKLLTKSYYMSYCIKVQVHLDLG